MGAPQASFIFYPFVMTIYIECMSSVYYVLRKKYSKK